MTEAAHKMRAMHVFVTALFLLSRPCMSHVVTLANSKMSFAFGHTNNESLALLSANVTGAASALRPGGFTELWQLQLLTADGYELCSTGDTVSSSITLQGTSAAILQWSVSCPGGARLRVEQTWLLPPSADTARIRMAVYSDAGAAQNVGLWAVTTAVGAIPQGEAFFPSGFGEVLAAGYGTASGRYPGGSSAMQFLAARGDGASSGMYFAAHDPAGHMKYLYAHEHNNCTGKGTGAIVEGGAGVRSPHQRMDDGAAAAAAADTQLGFASAPLVSATDPAFHDCLTPLAPHGFPYVGCACNSQSLTITTLVEGAGNFIPDAGYVLPFEVAVAPLPVAKAAARPRSLWFDAAELYRGWALPSAEWTQKGPISARPQAFPQWFLNLNVWINTGWQCLDRFNDTQGDPPTVLRNVRAIKQRFNLTDGAGLGLHWYEWQCGFSDNCTEDHGARRFKFDTEYPDYFPARRGSGFRDAVDTLRAEGVYTFPYINGRIFDNNSASFINDDGISKVVKQVQAPVLDTASGNGGVAGELTECKSYYGSHELNGQDVLFDVADPTTTYWQEKYADTVGQLVNDSHVAGVYIDQLCAASPVADWSARLQHGTGGGAWWRRGLVELLDKARAQSRTVAPLVTESNAEFLMDEVNGLLTLEAFGVPFAPPPVPSPGHRVLVPAFAAVYGGYYVAFGSVYTTNDLALNPDVFASRLATSFVYGAQMGWFSLGGVDHGPNLDTKCGPMHTLDAFLSPDRDAEVAYLRMLAQARSTVQRYFVHGRLVAPIELAQAPATFLAPDQAIAPRNPGPFPTLSTAVWQAAGDTTLCVFLVTSTRAETQAAFVLDMEGVYGVEGEAFDVFLLSPHGGTATVLDRVRGSNIVPLNRTVPGRTVEMIEIRKVVS